MIRMYLRNNRLRFGTLQKLLVTNDPNEFEKYSVEVGDFKKLPFILEEIKSEY